MNNFVTIHMTESNHVVPKTECATLVSTCTAHVHTVRIHGTWGGTIWWGYFRGCKLL